MRHSVWRHCLGAAAALAVSAAVSLCADVVESVEWFLAEHGMVFGYDAGTDTCVFIGTAVRDIDVPVSSPAFLSARNKMVRVAELEAKAEIMQLVSSKMSGERETRLAAGDEAFSLTARSLVSVFSGVPLHGCETVCVREEMGEKGFRVAVAVKWSAAQESEARAAKQGNVDLSRLSERDEWSAWAASFDFARAGSTASFTGSDGIRRWVGIGYADIEEKHGAQIAAAMRVARETATAELAYSLFGDTAARAVARRILNSFADGNGRTMDMTAEEFESQISQAVHLRAVRATEVYTTAVIHPLTRRKLFVSVVGMEPRDITGLKPIGGGNAEADDSRTPRPDHDWRPPSTRPDHSVHPASVRPIHP